MRRTRRRARTPESHEVLAETPAIHDIALAIGRAAARLAEEDRSDEERLQASLKGSIAELTGKERQRLALAWFDRLPPEQGAKMLLTIFGDNTLRVALESRRAEANSKVLAQIAETAERSGGFDLTLLPQDSVMEVWLYDADSYNELPLEELDEEAQVKWVLRFAHLGQGSFHFLGGSGGSVEEVTSLLPELEAHQIIELGCYLNRGRPDARLKPVLYQGAAIDTNLVTDSRFHIYNLMTYHEDLLVVGFVDVNGVALLSES